jgi:U6 snRNA phosphodiesterase
MNKLVIYSSSSEEDPLPSPKKRKKLLPVPFEKSEKKTVDNSVDHEGRKRQIEHIDGNWASHIFIEPAEDFLLKFTDFIAQVESKFKDIKSVSSPHVSLSKMFILKYHWIDNFFKVLTQNVVFKSFSLEFSTQLTFLSNEDKSRHFACLLIEDSSRAQIQSIVNQIDESLKEFQLPAYYENPIYHISLLWKLSEFSKEEKLEIPSKMEALMSKDENFYTLIDKITLKTGNKVKFLNSL